MPKINRNSGVHRIAGIALFRALLQQCRRLPPTVSATDRESLSNIVRNRFKRNQHVESERFLTRAFDAGYAALRLLRSVSSTSGSCLSLIRIRYILENIEPSYKATPPPTKRALKLYRPRGPPPRGPLPFEHSVWARPALVVKGVRKVPYFVNASGFPMLRVKKPQPVALTRAIIASVKRREREVQTRDRIVEHLPSAEGEDTWDELLLEQFGPGAFETSISRILRLNSNDKSDSEEHFSRFRRESANQNNLEGFRRLAPLSTRWQDELRTSLREMHEQRIRELQENLRKAKRLQAIVEEEKFLAAKEEEERRAAAASASASTDTSTTTHT